ncbi:MAG: GIN domain-containing protein, partial [Myxococcales bacterium]
MASPVLLACLLACNLPTGGTATPVADVRQVGAFSELEIGSGIGATVTPGVQSVRLRGPSDLLAKVRTEVAGGRLFVLADEPLLGSDVELVVTVPVLRALVAGGGSVVRAEGVAANDEVLLAASGGSLIEMVGQSFRVVAELSGGSTLEGADLLASVAVLNTSGGSTVELSVAQQLEVEASGGSVVRVFGRPAVTREQISGGSRLVYESAGGRAGRLAAGSRLVAARRDAVVPAASVAGAERRESPARIDSSAWNRSRVACHRPPHPLPHGAHSTARHDRRPQRAVQEGALTPRRRFASRQRRTAGRAGVGKA